MNDEINYILNRDSKFRFMMLYKLQLNIQYFIETGHYNILYGGGVKEHITLMKKLYRSFTKQDGKPVWCTMEQIKEYNKRSIENG